MISLFISDSRTGSGLQFHGVIDAEQEQVASTSYEYMLPYATDQQDHHNSVGTDDNGVAGSAAEDREFHRYSGKLAIQSEDEKANNLESSYNIDDTEDLQYPSNVSYHLDAAHRIESPPYRSEVHAPDRSHNIGDPRYRSNASYSPDGAHRIDHLHYRSKVSDLPEGSQRMEDTDERSKISNLRDGTKGVNDGPSASLPKYNDYTNSNKEHSSEGSKSNVSVSSLASAGSRLDVHKQGLEGSFVEARHDEVMQHGPTTLPPDQIKAPMPGSKPTNSFLNGIRYPKPSTTQTKCHLNDGVRTGKINTGKRYAHDTSHLSEPMPNHIDYNASDTNANNTTRRETKVANSSSKIVSLSHDRLFKQNLDNLLEQTQHRLGKGSRRTANRRTKKKHHKCVELPSSILQLIKKKRGIKRTHKKRTKYFQALVTPQDVLAQIDGGSLKESEFQKFLSTLHNSDYAAQMKYFLKEDSRVMNFYKGIDSDTGTSKPKWDLLPDNYGDHNGVPNVEGKENWNRTDDETTGQEKRDKKEMIPVNTDIRSGHAEIEHRRYQLRESRPYNFQMGIAAGPVWSGQNYFKARDAVNFSPKVTQTLLHSGRALNSHHKKPSTAGKHTSRTRKRRLAKEHPKRKTRHRKYPKLPKNILQLIKKKQREKNTHKRQTRSFPH